jgi:ribosomal protein L7/L12
MDAKTATLIKHLVDVAVERPDYDHLVIKIMQKLLDDMDSYFGVQYDPSSAVVAGDDEAGNKASSEARRAWVKAGQEISRLEAIKMYRDHWNCSLVEAKNSVEKYFSDHGLQFARIWP